MNKNVAKILVLLFVAAFLPLSASGEYKKNDNAAISRGINVFTSLFKELNTYYVDTIDVEKSIETAVGSMLMSLDPYTEYYPEREEERLRVITTGEYGGVGSYIQQRDSVVIFSEPQIGTPSAKAGIKAGDRIIKIDSVSTIGYTNDKVSSLLKGTPKTTVTVTVQRPWVEDSIKTFTLVRDKIRVNPVPFYGVKRGNIGYINVSTFNERTGSAVKEALVALKADAKVKAIALDLRGNTGGLLEEAVKVVGLFVPKGTEVLQTRGRQTTDVKVYKTTQKPVDTDIPLFVLVDGNSASASEIVAGALQDLDRAVIIGSRSFGKGLVQTTRPLPYKGLLKVTIAKYYIPSGRLIQEIDYSRRDANGSAKRVPDSLTHVFYTAHGREVRDGGGITPDIKVKSDSVNRLLYNIYVGNWAFDYATKYANTHATVAEPAKFKVTDEMFSEFKASIDPTKFSYDKVCELGLAELRRVAEAEGYANDSIKAQFEVLAKLLKHDLNHDLDHNREAISRMISDEIMQRYYYEPGKVECSLNDDRCLDEVQAVVANGNEYRRILALDGKANAANKAKKAKK